MGQTNEWKKKKKRKPQVKNKLTLAQFDRVNDRQEDQCTFISKVFGLTYLTLGKGINYFL